MCLFLAVIVVCKDYTNGEIFDLVILWAYFYCY